MPIYIETPSELAPVDIEDLKKIYADYPVDAAHARLDNWPQALNEGWQIINARFNDRLLGAMWLREDNGQMVVHDVCVREITRRRGVGTRLLSVTQEAHSSIQLASIPPEIPDSTAIATLAQKLGITLLS